MRMFSVFLSSLIQVDVYQRIFLKKSLFFFPDSVASEEAHIYLPIACLQSLLGWIQEDDTLFLLTLTSNASSVRGRS